ncbi:MAG: cytidylate kinase-like family protein [Eubacterium sp.]|nr:cytidylate kinase-like family protein [Eubacterium sp.]
MDKQMIISIGREYGANGHFIADKLAEKYNLPVYDSHMIEYIAKEKNLNLNDLKKYDEKMKNRLFSRTVDGHSSSPEDAIANMQFDFLREKAAAGESFVVVGRCANSVLRDNPNLISIFVTGDMEIKAKRISSLFGVTIKEAEAMIVKNNKKRKQYHNHYSKEKWGDSRYYELTINTSKIGIQKAFEIVDTYVQSRMI